MRFLLSCLCLSFVLILAGCGTPADRRLDAPVIEITGLTAGGDGYALALRLINSNTVPLVVRHSTHTLYLGDKRIGRIEDREPIGVPPLGAASHTVALPKALAADVRFWLTNHAGEVHASMDSSLEIVIGEDDSMILKSTGRGTVKAP
jgi:LEA14-like dessication related protein